MARRTLVLDCDPGQDDAVAILLALASAEELELRAITTVAGNVPLVRTTDNALRLVELAGAAVPVHAGAARPLLRPLVTAEHVHGESGIDGAELPPARRRPEPEPAALAIARHLLDPTARRPTLVATGPLTNVALALALYPELARRLEAIVLMGGAVGLGNVTPAAEFNMHVDPHAARMVLAAGVPVVMFPLDVTHQVLVTDARLERIGAVGTRAARAVAGMLAFYRAHGRTGGARDGPLHDPCTIAWLLRPELFKGRSCRVEVECESPLGLGRTYVDLHGSGGGPAHVQVMLEADAEGFFHLLTEALARLP